MSGLTLAPSLLAADFARLGEQVHEAEEAGAEWFHFDVMDGHYVPNLSIGIPVLKSLRAVTDAFLDVHLMIDNPRDFIGPFASAGADLITIHQEASVHLADDIQEMRRLGVRVGVAINPSTSAEVLSEILPVVDLVLVMTVNPGFGGQKFISSALSKVRQLRDRAGGLGLDGLDIQVDGGVDRTTALPSARAGANILVAGSSVFRGPGSIRENYDAIRKSLAVSV